MIQFHQSNTMLILRISLVRRASQACTTIHCQASSCLYRTAISTSVTSPKMLCTRPVSVPGRYYTWDFNDGSTFSYRGRTLRKLKANVAEGDQTHLYDRRAVYVVDAPPMADNSLGPAVSQQDNYISGAGLQFGGAGGLVSSNLMF